MILQFVAHIAVIKLSKWIITQIAEVCSDKPPPKVAEFYNLDVSQHVSVSQKLPNSEELSRTISRSMSYVSSIEDLS